MNTFWKVNVISALYAAVIFIPIELYVNIFRISRLTGWRFQITGTVIGISAVLSVIFLSAVINYLTKNWMKNRKSSYWSLLLWLPYLMLFSFIFVSLFPITNPQDEVGPGGGLIILGLLVVYPLFVLFLNSFSTFTNDT